MNSVYKRYNRGMAICLTSVCILVGLARLRQGIVLWALAAGVTVGFGVLTLTGIGDKDSVHGSVDSFSKVLRLIGSICILTALLSSTGRSHQRDELYVEAILETVDLDKQSLKGVGILEKEGYLCSLVQTHTIMQLEQYMADSSMMLQMYPVASTNYKELQNVCQCINGMLQNINTAESVGVDKIQCASAAMVVVQSMLFESRYVTEGVSSWLISGYIVCLTNLIAILYWMQDTGFIGEILPSLRSIKEVRHG